MLSALFLTLRRLTMQEQKKTGNQSNFTSDQSFPSLPRRGREAAVASPCCTDLQAFLKC